MPCVGVLPASCLFLENEKILPQNISIEMSVDEEKPQEIEEMLNKRRWAKDCLRVNIAEPDKIIQRGKIKIAMIQSEVLHQKEAKLWEAIKAIAPEWWGDEETQVLLNKNVTCKKHTDGNNSYSYILWLGDFSGGALLFEDGTRLEQHHVWHKVHAQNAHWNEPHEGTKYGIVLYRRGVKHTKQQMMMKARQRKVEGAAQQQQQQQQEQQQQQQQHDAIC